MNYEVSDRERSSYEDSSDYGSVFEVYRKFVMFTFGKVLVGKGFEFSKYIRLVDGMYIYEYIMNIYWIGYFELVIMFFFIVCSIVFFY